MPPLAAETVLFESKLDWTTGRITTNATLPLGTIDAPLAAARSAATDAIRSELSEHISRFLSSVPLDSSVMIGDLIQNSPYIRRKIDEFASHAEPSVSYTDPKLTQFTLRFEHSLFPELARILVTHSKAVKHEPTVGFSPTTQYTGLVIFAKGVYPVHGESDRESSLLPALQPKIYDESMRVLLESDMVAPRIAVEEGIVAYTDSIDLLRFRDRIGEFPLVTMARSIFGTNRTDLVIPMEIGERLLASETNRRLIESGRVLIINDMQLSKRPPTLSNQHRQQSSFSEY